MPRLILYTILYYFTFLRFFSDGSDTLLPHQTLVVGNTLVSSNDLFEAGFFHPGSSKNTFLGTWYKSTPEVVAWVANRNNPVVNSRDTFLTIHENKSLAIMSGGRAIWSSNSTRVASNPVLKLMDTGNLVLVDRRNEGCLWLWQSFDHPTDTQLPGMKVVSEDDDGVGRYLTSWRSLDDPSPGDYTIKLQNRGLPDAIVFKGMKKMYRMGTWNGIYWSGSIPFPTPYYNPEVVFREEKLISIQAPYSNSTFTRVTIDAHGALQYSILDVRKGKWNPIVIRPEDPCEEYGKCGPFGICMSGILEKCQCMKGFVPKSKKDWHLQDWSGGCRRIIPLNDCQGERHGFLEVKGISFPDMLQFWLNMSMSLHECRVKCLRNCSCIAYANPYITNGGSGCLMWFGELIDTRYLPRDDDKQKIYIRLPQSELDSSAVLDEGEKKNKPMIFILISIVSGVLVSCFIHGGLHYMARQMKQDITTEKTHENLELLFYKWSTIMTATNNFSTENLLGEGGFGSVYLGNLSVDMKIAVKRLSRNSGQGLEEFRNEIMLIAKLQHRNLVRLLGYCIEKEERVLIYEYLPNKSLDTFLFDADQNRRAWLTWPKRFDIIVGIARGLLYLHHDSRLKIIHRDLKTSNILLDCDLNPKISDFGIARIFEENQSTLRTKRVVGTYGYMSPEYAIAGKFSTKSDVFSLGVMLLEIICGKRNGVFIDSHQCYGLIGHAWLLWRENRTLELMDECLTTTFIESQVKRCAQVGLLCVQRDIEDRPDMISVYSMLVTDEATLPEPKEPGFFTIKGSCIVKSEESMHEHVENGTMTFTDVEAR